MNYDESISEYIIKEFKPKHNHLLSSNKEVHLIRLHKKGSDVGLKQAKALKHRLKTCQFMDYMTDHAKG